VWFLSPKGGPTSAPAAGIAGAMGAQRRTTSTREKIPSTIPMLRRKELNERETTLKRDSKRK
jgi:hypothetical protein